MDRFGAAGARHIVDGDPIDIGQDFAFELIAQQHTGACGHVRRVKAEAGNQVAEIDGDLPPIIITGIVDIAQVDRHRTTLTPACGVGEILLAQIHAACVKARHDIIRQTLPGIQVFKINVRQIERGLSPQILDVLRAIDQDNVPGAHRARGLGVGMLRGIGRLDPSP